MKELLRKIFSPILTNFEQGEGAYAYKASHRSILVIVGGLFFVLSLSIIAAGLAFSQLGAAVPGLVFFAVGTTCLVVGGLGTDRAVAKIWGSK